MSEKQTEAPTTATANQSLGVTHEVSDETSVVLRGRMSSGRLLLLHTTVKKAGIPVLIITIGANLDVLLHCKKIGG